MAPDTAARPLDYDKVKNWPIAPVTQRYTQRDTILYALGIGAATGNPPADEDLPYIYEQGLRALPTMAVVLGEGPFWMQDPETGIDWKRVLHGEQFLRLHRPLPVQGTIVAQTRVEEIWDKGADKGAVMLLGRSIVDTDSGDEIASVGMTTFLRGNGGFGGSAEGAPRPKAVPVDRAPDAVLDLVTRPEQAAIYRLSGDYNPLHIDARVARGAGFDRPILHGLCSYGVACRAVLRLLCSNDPGRLRRFDARFVRPVFPGETLRTQVWHEGGGRAAFRVRVVERDTVVLDHGCVEFTF